MRLIDADRLLKRIERAKENNDELDDNIITIIEDMPTELAEKVDSANDDSFGVSVYAFCDILKSKLSDTMSKEDIVELIDDILK